MVSPRALVVAALAARAAAVPQAAAAPQQPCNNAAALCGRPYNQVTHLGAHDSSFLRDGSTGNSQAGNQFRNATVALDAGLRLLQTQVHKVQNSGLRLCHSCGILDAGPVDAWLAAVADWVARNPRDVVSLILVNADKVPASELAPVVERSGLARFAYRPASPAAATPEWPTLDAMIAKGGRVVVFVTNMDADSQYPYLLPQFQHVFETPFEVTQLGGFNCSVDRPRSLGPAPQAMAKGYMGLANHFKYQPLGAGLLKSVVKSVGLTSDILVPDVDHINTVNSPGSSADGNLGRHLDRCRSEWGRPPTFVLVDFWDRANPIEATDRLNGLGSVEGRKAAAVLSAAPRGPVAAAWLAVAALSLWLL